MTVKNFAKQASESVEREVKLSKLREVIDALEQKRANDTQGIPPSITPAISPGITQSSAPTMPRIIAQMPKAIIPETTQKYVFEKENFEDLKNEITEMKNSVEGINSIEKRLDEIARGIVAVANIKSNENNEGGKENIPLKNSVERIENRLSEMGEVMNQLMHNQKIEKKNKQIRYPRKQSAVVKFLIGCSIALIGFSAIFAYMNPQETWMIIAEWMPEKIVQ